MSTRISLGKDGVASLSRGLKALIWASGVGMFLVLIAGALVSQTGSGDGCGASWPLCHGRWLPDGTTASLIEYNHRVVSGITGILVLALSIVMWRNYGWRPEARLFAGLSVFFLVLQSALGAWVVLAPQPDWLLAIHFGVSLTAFAGVVLSGVLLYQLHGQGTGRDVPVSPQLRRWAWVTILVVYLVVYTGAYVRHTNSNLACLDWPLCNGRLIPADLFGPEGIQFLHRLAALGGTLVVGRLFYLAAKERQRRPDIYRAAAWSLALIIAQALAGGLSVLTRLNGLAVMAHSAIITLLFGVLACICLQVMPEPALADRRAAQPAGAAGARTQA